MFSAIVRLVGFFVFLGIAIVNFSNMIDANPQNDPSQLLIAACVLTAFALGIWLYHAPDGSSRG